MSARPTLRDFTGATLIRFESADGLRINLDDTEAQRRIEHGSMSLRGLPGHINGDLVEPYLYAVLRIDPHRFVWDLPRSMKSNGAVSGGERSGFLFARGQDGKAEGRAVGKVTFLTTDRRLREVDPESRADFEEMRLCP